MILTALAATAATIDWYTTSADFEAAASTSTCPTAMLDFETLPFRIALDDEYASAGVRFSGLLTPVIDDTVGASPVEFVGTRGARVPIEEDYGADDLPPYIRLEFDPTTTAVSFQLVGFGNGDDGDSETAVVDLYAGTTLVGTVSAVPGGSTVNGGVFVGIVTDTPFDALVLEAESLGDGIGFDDVWWRGADCIDADGDGMTPAGGDCDDGDPATYTGAVELCDGLDQDCDGAVGPGETDEDHDQFLDCVDTDHDGVSTYDGDCDPWDATVHPGASDSPAICDGIDNACDGLDPWDVDGDHDQFIDCVDTDGDGVSTYDGDCDPWEPAMYPGAEDSAALCDGLDNDCDGVDPWDQDTDYDALVDCVDSDADGYTTYAGDCAPWDPARNPGAAEACDGLDTNCDGAVPPDELDADGDGFRVCANDCDDNDETIHPFAQELENGVDARCDGERVGAVLGCQALPGGPSLPALLLLAPLFLRRRR